MKIIDWNQTETYDIEYIAGCYATLKFTRKEGGLKCDIFIKDDKGTFNELLGSIKCSDFDVDNTRQYAMNMLNNEVYMRERWLENIKGKR